MVRNEEANGSAGLNIQTSATQNQHQNGGVESSGSSSKRKQAERDIRVYYALPKDRFINYVRFFMVFEICVSAGLFCTVYAKANSGSPFRENSHAYGSGDYPEMILDVILVEIIQFVLILFTHMRLESLVVRLVDTPFDRKFALSKKRYHVFNIMLTTLTLVYYCIKGSLMLAHQINSNFSQNMIENYFMMFVTLCDCFHVAAAVLFCFQIRKVPAMTREPRNIHYYNKQGLRVDSDGVPVNQTSKIKFASHVQRVLALTRPEWKLLVLGTLCLLVASVSVMLLPYFFGQVIDNALDPKSDSLNRNVMILGVIAASGSLFAFVRGWAFSLAGYRLVSSLRKDLFRAIVRQEIAFFDASRVGELTSRLSSDTQVIQTNITTNMSMLLRYVVQIMGSVAVMLWLSAPLTAVMLSVIPVVAIGAAQYGRYYSRKVKAFQDALGVANTTAEESLSNIRTIRSFACDEKACENYDQDIDNSLKVGSNLALVYGMFQGIISLLIQASLVLILWYGGKLVLEHSKDPSKGVSIGVLSSFMMYALNVAMAFAFLSSIFGDIMKAVGASYRLFAIMDREPQVQERGTVALVAAEDDGTSSPFEPKVEFKDVTFSYPSRPTKEVIKNISFCVDAGQTVALVGPSGGGKSTCINLLLHFYEPSHGKILFSNEDIQDLKCEWYHEQIAVVSQEPVLFGFSVAENIAFGSDFSIDQIKEAATLANAHEFISNLDQGYDSLVGERGVRLSGGQKQRIAIARALIRNPKVLLLDEATSALDAESEAIVKDAIDRAMKNRTVLVIAHRLSTVIDADMVIVIEDGEIREKGSHEELICLDGVYKKLIVNQLMKTSDASLQLVDAENQADMSKSPRNFNETQTSFEPVSLPDQTITNSNFNSTHA